MRALSRELYSKPAAGKIRFGVQPSTVSLRIREPGSALTHVAALILMLTGAGPLLMRARLAGSGLTVASMLIFVLGCCALYLASTVYHTVVLSEEKTRIFKKLDHMMIPIMIAGTYTPVCLLALRGRAGVGLLIGIWSMALLAILLKALWITCPKWVSSVLYLAMGWLCVLAMPRILAALPRPAFGWLLAGGLLYSAGALIYASKPRAFDAAHPYFGSHEIFHVFIMAGTFCHYMLMFRFLAYLP